MKIVSLVIVLVAALKSDGRHFSDEPTGQVSSLLETEELSLSDKPVDSDSVDGDDQYITFGPKIRDNNKPEIPVALEEDDNHSENLLRGKRGKANLQKLIKNYESLKYNLTQDNLKMKTELQYIKNNQNNISNTDSKFKMLILSQLEKLTVGDKQLEMEVQYLKENQNNISDTDTKMKTILLTEIRNITDGGKQLKMELQSMKYGQNNITETNKDLQIEMRNAMNNITNRIISKLNSMITIMLTMDAVKVTGRLAHFPYATHKKSWEDAKKFCQTIGGQIYTPLDKAATVAAFKACGTLCWNGWHKNSKGQWVTGFDQVKKNNFWNPSEPGGSDDAAWSSAGGLWGRSKKDLYGWTCQM